METNQSKTDNYKEVIKNIDMLTSRMEFIAREYFEVHIDFINKMGKVELDNRKPIDDKLFEYNDKFKNLLSELESETKTLKKDKINFQFRRNLLLENSPLS